MFGRREILSGGLAAMLAPTSALATTPDRGEKTAIVNAFVRDNAFHGVVVTAKAGRIDFAQAFGYADVAAKQRTRVTTGYCIASISKWLSTVTLLRLCEAGKASLASPIIDMLPDYRPDTGAKVTLAHLLSNTSGIPNDFIAAAKLDPTLTTTDLGTAESVRRFCQGDLAFEPGSRFDYALTNWFIVTAIVERLTGTPFQDAVRDIMLRPLALTHTGADTAEPSSAPIATSYRSFDPPVIWPNPRVPVMAAGGGYFSTAQDLVRAAHQVFDLGFLKPESLQALATVRVPDQDYSLGGRVRTMTIDGQPVRAAWETGRTAGYRSVLGHRSDTQETVVVLNNSGLSQKTMDLFADQLFGAAPRP